MATILSGDVTVEYLDNNRMKMLYWSGTTGTYTMNELYSAMATLLDEETTIDDGTCFSAETPVEYTIGKIDAGDSEPWYITFDLMEHITGGALRTSGWERSTGTNTGIIIVPVNNATNNIVSNDVGQDISGGTDGNGTLLEVIVPGGATDYLVIRPDSSGSGDDFTTNTQTITEAGSSHTAVQNQAGSNTGEMIWANLYSIGTIEADTHIYLYQGIISDDSRSRVYSWNDNTQDWWGDGHIDVCVAMKDITASTWSTIDGGYISVFARKGNTLYDNFETTTSTVSGGRNPIPLATAPDLDNTTGYKSITTTAVGTDDFSVGDEIEGQSSGARAIITQIDGSDPTYTFHYYLIDDPLTDFQTAAETVDNNDSSGTATKDGNPPADQGPALSTWFTNNTTPTIGVGGFTYTTADIDDDGSDENYGITVNCQSNPLTEVYEWLKYVTRRGNTATTDADGVPAESYIGGEVYLSWTGSVSGTIAEGADVEQATTLATGVIIAYDATAKVMLLRNTRGTFESGYVVTDQDNSGYVTIDNTPQTFSPKKASPFGTFAGGTFFGARGVLLDSWVTADENAFILTPIEGGTKERPQAVEIAVTNLVGTDETTNTDDRVAVYRLDGSGGNIDKTEYSAAGGESPGDATLVIDTGGGITQDTPGKTTGGVLMLRDADDNNTEYRIRYSSWSSSTFTLANIVGTAETGTNTTTIIDTGVFSTAKRGDLVYNSTRAAVSYVTTVDSNDQITISPAITAQTQGDSFELNCVPISTNTADDVYVALIDRLATASEESVSIIYPGSTIYFRVKVRNTRASDPDGPIEPFSVDDSTSGTDKSIATIRNIDTIIT
jgi:hypothetical protein